MKPKLFLIIALAAAALSVVNIVVQVSIKTKQLKYENEVSSMKTRFNEAQRADEYYKRIIHNLQQQVQFQQFKIDSLNTEAALLQHLAETKQQTLQDIKKLLQKPNTSFSDSTAQTILKNLPK